MNRILSVYLIAGIIACLTEIISFQFIFWQTKNYFSSSRISYVLSALISFIGNLKYGFRIRITPVIFILGFSFILILNLYLLNVISKYYKKIKINPLFANFFNILITTSINLIVYYLITKIFIWFY